MKSQDGVIRGLMAKSRSDSSSESRSRAMDDSCIVKMEESIRSEEDSDIVSYTPRNLTLLIYV